MKKKRKDFEVIAFLLSMPAQATCSVMDNESGAEFRLRPKRRFRVSTWLENNGVSARRFTFLGNARQNVQIQFGVCKISAILGMLKRSANFVPAKSLHLGCCSMQRRTLKYVSIIEQGLETLFIQWLVFNDVIINREPMSSRNNLSPWKAPGVPFDSSMASSLPLCIKLGVSKKNRVHNLVFNGIIMTEEPVRTEK